MPSVQTWREKNVVYNCDSKNDSRQSYITVLLVLFTFSLKCILYFVSPQFSSVTISTCKNETTEKNKRTACVHWVFSWSYCLQFSEVSYGCFNECTFIALLCICFVSYDHWCACSARAHQIQSTAIPDMLASLFTSLSSQVEEVRLEVTRQTVAEPFQQLVLPKHILILNLCFFIFY